MNGALLPVKEDQFEEKFLRMRMHEHIQPASAEEYLARVRIEAQDLPDIMLSDVEPTSSSSVTVDGHKKNPRMPTFMPIQELLRESKLHTRAIHDFVTLRQTLVRWEEASRSGANHVGQVQIPTRTTEEDVWNDFCFGHKSGRVGHVPTLQILFQLDQRNLRTLLELHIRWLEIHWCSQPRALWLYALFTRLEKPLDGPTCANVRQLLRRLETRVRASDGSPLERSSCTLLGAICIEVFGQGQMMS